MKLHSINLKKIKIQDPFWTKHVKLVEEAIIPYQWDAMNDRIPDAEPSHCLENFAIAAGRKKGEFYGAVFQDTDIAKWLEAVGFSLACLLYTSNQRRLSQAISRRLFSSGVSPGRRGVSCIVFSYASRAYSSMRRSRIRQSSKSVCLGSMLRDQGKAAVSKASRLWNQG